jgi:hypothetical protein
MDPISAVGAIAACIQLATNLLQGIHLLHDLRDVPSRMIDLLKEVELDIISIKRVLQLEPPSLRSLSPEQIDQLSPFAVEIQSAIEDLQMELGPLEQIKQSGIGRGKKMYLTLRSALKEKGTITKLERIKRLTTNLLVEMQRLGLETQCQIKYANLIFFILKTLIAPMVANPRIIGTSYHN